MSNNGLPPHQEHELEQALSDTVEEISKFCVVRFHGSNIRARVLEAARQQWRDRYTTSFTKAILEGHRWSTDRDQVLERAREVGYLAAFVASVWSVAAELVRAGVMVKKGQDIDLEPTAQPAVDSTIAEFAGRCIDCDMSRPKPEWIWCPPGGNVGASARAKPHSLADKELEAFEEFLKAVRSSLMP